MDEKGKYKTEIIKLINKTDNEAFLKFIRDMIMSFKKKWEI